MKLVRTSALLCVLLTLATASVGQESQPAAPAPAPAAPAPAAPGAKPPAAANGDAPPPAAQRAVVRDEEFIPTQEVQADEEVTFPVDI